MNVDRRVHLMGIIHKHRLHGNAFNATLIVLGAPGQIQFFEKFFEIFYFVKIFYFLKIFLFFEKFFEKFFTF